MNGNCRHCRRHAVITRKGLCRHCHGNEEVRDLYPDLPRAPRPITQPTAAVRNGAPACIHCGLRVQAQHGKLCQVCRSDKEVRSLYAPPSRMCERCGYRHVPSGAPENETLCADCCAGRPIPGRIAEANALLGEVSTGPVEVPPGSPERLAVLINRVNAGLPLWNRRDRLGDLR